MRFPLTTAGINRPAPHGYNKHNPDVTISHNGLEYDMERAPVYAYYASERLAQNTKHHERLSQYDHELMKDSTFIPHRERNPALEHARSIKIDRHRTMLPSLLF